MLDALKISLLSFLLCASLHAHTPSQLKKINEQIKALNKTLASVHNKKELLNRELALTEQKMGSGIETLHQLEQTINTKEQHITQLKNQHHELNKKMAIQQHLLANHIKNRYQMGEYQPLKWLVNQQDSSKNKRLLTYYQYLIKARHQLMMHIKEMKHTLDQQQQQIEQELQSHQQAQQTLVQQQHTLQQQKQYHAALIQTLNKQIQTHQHTLREYEQNKKNLAHIVSSLTQKSRIRPQVSSDQRHKKLPTPLQGHYESFKRMNQGLTFFADEGTPVTSVYPGVVVFSDWLKGYGLLLIIDHGQGLMTLYAHNQSLIKHKGQHVTQHEAIARVGHSGGLQQNGLYFEVRQHGKAISPLAWLALKNA